MGQGNRGTDRERPTARRNRPWRSRSSRWLLLPPDPTVVRRARGLVEDVCRAADLDEETCRTAVLLASETVTNAVVHARGDATLEVSAGEGLVLVEVGDEDDRRPGPVDRDPQAQDGRGLEIVRMLSRRWGVRDDPPGKVVWFEVGTPLSA